MPVSPSEIRPRSSTAVASVNTSPDPPTARLPRCTRCHVWGCPCNAEYSHIGETTMRFFSSTSLKRIELKRFILKRPLTGWMLRQVASSKYSCAYPNFRGAFFDGHLKIVGHSHRQDW